jgi:hypothetical protein
MGSGQWKGDRGKWTGDTGNWTVDRLLHSYRLHRMSFPVLPPSASARENYLYVNLMFATVNGSFFMAYF